ncbi:ABC transporter permease [Halalkalibacterium halodurans]|uniref:ABC transporter permease n=1 Tax=Halalkalibacterium halodurans TaxID=86665 RepID=UPI002AA9CB33|nr:ABC transporter permease [Halalkalibacterium halodurans]MDY7223215.1 ABC transporter permease [Halalkalibacterium halodurans]MDY7242436.1 ABC transporter permease [Halalkalibacterium halodurans]
MKRSYQALEPTLFFLMLMVIWEISARMIGQPYLLPSPIQIVMRTIDLSESLFFTHLPATLAIISIGLALSIALGILLSLLMFWNERVERAVYPLLVASQTIPVIALAPIFVLWFGYSIWSKVAVTVLLTFFPITVNTYDGLKSTNRQYEELFYTMGATKRQLFFRLFVPSTLPSFLTGLRIAVPLAVIGAAVGEWLGANEGLGYFSRRMMTQFDGPGVFAPIFILSLLGILGFAAIKKLENILLPWRKKQ